MTNNLSNANFCITTFVISLFRYVCILNEIVYNVSIYLIATKKINNIILIAFFV